MCGDWRRLLIQKLIRLKTHDPLRIAILGVGHELRGDDAAGMRVARVLTVLFAHQPHIVVLDGGHAPENQTGPLRRFRPDLVLLIDSARMGLPSGAIRWLTWQEASGLSASTHTLPLYMIAQYLIQELGCEVALIGIEPAHTDIGTELSTAVAQSVEEIVSAIQQVWEIARPRDESIPDKNAPACPKAMNTTFK